MRRWRAGRDSNPLPLPFAWQCASVCASTPIKIHGGVGPPGTTAGGPYSVNPGRPGRPRPYAEKEREKNSAVDPGGMPRFRHGAQRRKMLM